MVECYKCHKLGHFQYECQANYANLDESEDMVLMAYIDTLGGDRDAYGLLTLDVAITCVVIHLSSMI